MNTEEIIRKLDNYRFGPIPKCVTDTMEEAIEKLKEQEETIAAYAELLNKYGYEFK